MILPEQQDRVQGVLLGLGAGDRNGGPTQMALRLAQSLVVMRRFDVQAILHHYLDWWQAGAFDTGPTTAAVLKLVAQGLSYRDAAWHVHQAHSGMSAGCNPAHRAAPLAMAAFLATDDLAHYAQQEAALTHWDALAGDVAAVVLQICRALITGLNWEAALQYVSQQHNLQTRAVLAYDPTAPLSTGSFAPEVLRAAVAFIHTSESFDMALQSALSFAGPANYCPVLVGAIGGARWGTQHIPNALLNHHAHLDSIKQVARVLATEW